MKEEKNLPEQELIDVDEKGNPIEKKEEEKEKSSSIYKYTFLIIMLLFLLALIYFFLNKKTNNKSLFEEINLKNLKLKNRVFFGAVFDDSFKNGKFTEKGLKKFETLAKNDISLIVTGAAIVGYFSPSPIKGKESPRIDSDEYIEEFRKMPEIVHKYNTYILMQLVHVGLFSISDIIYSPSKDKGFISGNYSKEMRKEDILRIQDYFVKASVRAKKAGFDGIQIHGAHLGLVSLFLSNKFNRRTDGDQKKKEQDFWSK